MQPIDISEGTKPLTQSEYYGLYSELKSFVESYGGGLAALAQKVSISKPTLWRWVNFKNTKAPNPYHVLSLMKFITKKDTIRDIVSCVGGEIAEYIVCSFPADFEAPPKHLQLDINTLLEDFYCYFIYLITNTEKSISRNDVKEILGTYSLEQLDLSIEDQNISREMLIKLGQIADLKINKLIENSVLKEEGGYLNSLVPEAKIKISLTKSHLPKLFTFFKEKNMHKFSNHMYAYQEAIPRETIKKILDLQYDTFMKCYKLMDESKTPDGELYLLATYFDSLSFN